MSENCEKYYFASPNPVRGGLMLVLSKNNQFLELMCSILAYQIKLIKLNKREESN